MDAVQSRSAVAGQQASAAQHVTETSSAVPIAATFEAFLEEYNKNTGKNLTNTDMESLKRLFDKWRSEKEGG